MVSKRMYAALLCYTRRVKNDNSQRGVWMKDLGISISRARAQRKISQWGAAIVAALATLFGMAITASAQAPAPKRTVIHVGRVLNVRTGELRSNQTIVIEGDKISQIAPSNEVKAAAGDTTIDLPDATLLPGLDRKSTRLNSSHT